MAEPDAPDGVVVVRLARAAQLFNSLDPAPFQERELDAHAEEFIAAWAREIPEETELRIRVQLPAEEARADGASGLGLAIGNHFAYRAALAERDLRELFRVGRHYLAVGVAVLAGCLFVSRFLRASFPDSAFMQIVEESLLILGWVANWKPLETFLYDWWPIRRRIRLFRRLAAAPAEVVASARDGPP